MITIAEARAHWRDESAPCRIAMRARNEISRWYWANRWTELGRRRRRGRVLAQANQILHEIRCACPICRQPILWESGWIGGNSGMCRLHGDPRPDELEALY